MTKVELLTHLEGLSDDEKDDYFARLTTKYASGEIDFQTYQECSEKLSYKLKESENEK